MSVISSSGSTASSAEPPITALALLDDDHLLAASRSGVQILDKNNFESRGTLATDSPLVHKIFATNQRVLLLGGEPAEFAWGQAIPCSAASDLLDSSIAKTALPGLSIFEDCIYDAALSTDGQSILYGSLDGQAAIQELNGSKPAVVFGGHSADVTGTVWLNQDLVATSSRDTSIRVWKADSGELVRTLSQHTGEITSLLRSPNSDLSPEGRPLVASAGLDGTVRFWQPTIGRLVRFVKLDDELPSCLTWTLNGRFLVVGTTKGTIHWIDPSTAEILNTDNAATDWVTAMAADSSHVYYGTATGKLGQLKSYNRP